MIISGGSNIYPREVEEVLLELEVVAEVGRTLSEWGEEVVAFVVPALGQQLVTADLDAHCIEKNARFKRPKEYQVVLELSKNNYVKVLKAELRKLLISAVSDEK